MSHEELCRQLFAGLQDNEPAITRAVCAEQMTAQQNGGPPMTLSELLAFNDAVHRVVPDFHYEGAVCHPLANGFVEEHKVLGTLPDGSPLAFQACIVGMVEAGQIVALREYVDSFAARGLLKALQA